jgi:hypothetical protein
MTRLEVPPPAQLGVTTAFPIAALLAAVSLGGILLPSTYARETSNWAAQAVGQDWVDLLFAVPWLAVSAALARRGSRAGLLLLGGGLLYTIYELVIYAFAVRFNALFLLYSASLGSSLFALAAIAVALRPGEVCGWFGERLPLKTTGGLLIAIGLVFSALWLGEILPALARGTAPPSVIEAGIPTNPVQVMDLSAILPAHIAGGVLLLRRRPLGYVVSPILLGFGVLMSMSIAGMMVVMRLRGEPASMAVAATLAGLSLATAVVLVRTLRAIR